MPIMTTYLQLSKMTFFVKLFFRHTVKTIPDFNVIFISSESSVESVQPDLIVVPITKDTLVFGETNRMFSKYMCLCVGMGIKTQK